MAKQLISNSEAKPVYHDGSAAIREFCEDFPRAEVLNEALYGIRVKAIEVLNVPEVLKASVIDDKWSITKELVEDKILQQLIEENPDKTGEYLEQMADLHLLISAQAYPLLNKLKEEIIRAPKSEEQLGEDLRYELLARLDGMPKYTRLCHEDSCPSNIIVDDDDKWYLIDWVHASQGNVSAGVARTCLLLSLKDKKIADMYMDLFCDKTDTEKCYVQDWLPIVAVTQLAYKRLDGKGLLESWVNVFGYQ